MKCDGGGSIATGGLDGTESFQRLGNHGSKLLAVSIFEVRAIYNATAAFAGFDVGMLMRTICSMLLSEDLPRQLNIHGGKAIYDAACDPVGRGEARRPLSGNASLASERPPV
jgi:hypothetical protein